MHMTRCHVLSFKILYLSTIEFPTRLGWKSLRVRYGEKVKSRPLLFQDGLLRSLNGPLNVIHGSAIDSFPLSILGGELRISTMFRCLVVG